MIRFTKSKGRLGPKKSRSEYSRTYKTNKKAQGLTRVSVYLSERAIDRLKKIRKRLFHREKPLSERTRTAVITQGIEAQYLNMFTSTTEPPETEKGACNASIVNPGEDIRAGFVPVFKRFGDQFYTMPQSNIVYDTREEAEEAAKNKAGNLRKDCVAILKVRHRAGGGAAKKAYNPKVIETE